MDDPFTRSIPKAVREFRPCESLVCKRNSEFIHNINRQLDNAVRIAFPVDEKEINEQSLKQSVDEVNTVDAIFLKETKENSEVKLKIAATKMLCKDTKNLTNENKNIHSKLEAEAVVLQKESMSVKDKLTNNHKVNLFFHHLYKKYTNCNIKLDSASIAKIEFAPDVYLKLRFTDSKYAWSLVEVKPDVIELDDLKQKLYETDDVQALIACAYKCFQPFIDHHST